MERLMQRLAVSVVLAGAVLLLALVGLGFLAASLYLALATQLAPPLAALATGGGVLLLAILIIAASRGRPSGASAAAPPPAVDLQQVATLLGAQLGEQAAGFSKTHPWGSIAASLATGVAFGASPQLRALLSGQRRR